MEKLSLIEAESYKQTEKIKELQRINYDDDIMRRRINLQKAQHTIFIWLKTNDTNCQDTSTQLQDIVSTAYTFEDSDECVDFITTVTDNKVCLILAASLERHTIPCIHEISQLHSIFIFGNSITCNDEWKKAWSKVRGIFTEVTVLCQELKQLTRQHDQNDIPISFVTPGEKSDKLDPTFMYTQIMKDFMLTIEYNEEHLSEYCNYCCDTVADNLQTVNSIRQFERDYNEKSPIWCYSYHTFLYSMLNRSLRILDGDIIRRMGFFITALHRAIEQLHKEQNVDNPFPQSFTVYRGQALPKATFDHLKKAKHGLISFNNFLSTSTDSRVAHTFAESNATNPDDVGIIYVMNIEPTHTTTPFASIQEISNFFEENEILFSMHSIFRIHDIEPTDDIDKIYKVHLFLTSDNDQDLHNLTEYIKHERYTALQSCYGLPQLLIDIGQQNAAEPLCQSLLRNTDGNDDRIFSTHMISYLLGRIKQAQGNYNEALAFCQNTLTNVAELFPPNHSDLPGSYTNIGLVHREMGNYSQALEYHEKALSIQKQSLPLNHPNLAGSYTNIGVVHHVMGNYSQALEYHEKALSIQTESLPLNHPDLALSYTNIGLVHDETGNYSQALEYHEKALSIQKQSLPLNHPNLAGSYTNIGVVHHVMGNYSQALEYHEKALSIQTQSLPLNHPDLARSYTNIGLVHHVMGNYSQALEYHEKALLIDTKSLPLNHPNLAASYTNIGLVHDEMGNYSQALEYHEKALSIYTESLPLNHPDLALSYTNIGVVHRRMGNYSEALEYHEKALSIQKQSLPLNHPNLAASYVRIGLVLERNGDVLRARYYYRKGLEIWMAIVPLVDGRIVWIWEKLGYVYRKEGKHGQVLAFCPATSVRMEKWRCHGRRSE
ncbi:unnamed protein product [Adineta ricciae]|uniref:ADP ribosyltransferase domain-containing protein n=1 Tax=Adineta ricciae TaxID=249248 RepID=A0A814AXL5_ADIRI|nr:unnamed protein product [Adineta ricciae]CAF1594922.1 unnamed protein product [Adineta ricciae]